MEQHIRKNGTMLLAITQRQNFCYSVAALSSVFMDGIFLSRVAGLLTTT
jgi:hypothetical protein